MKKIIVVDDDATTRFMMSELLDAMGYECETVSSGMACIALLRMRPNEFSMVLMDIHMPGVTGLDTVSYIRTLEEDPPLPPIAAFTRAGRCRLMAWMTYWPSPWTWRC